MYVIQLAFVTFFWILELVHLENVDARRRRTVPLILRNSVKSTKINIFTSEYESLFIKCDS